MKIIIRETIAIDKKSWADEFGVAEKDVRKDVEQYFSTWLQQQVEKIGMQESQPLSESLVVCTSLTNRRTP